MTAASLKSFVSRYKVPLIAAKILLSVALFAYDDELDILPHS